jgi:hypothetical protein
MKSIPISLFILFLISCGQQPTDNKSVALHTKPTSVLAPVLINGFWGFIDTNGGMTIPAKFKQGTAEQNNFPHFQEGLCVLTDLETSKKGAIDSSGAWVIQPRFYDLASFSEGISSCQMCSGCVSVFVDKKDSVTVFYDVRFVSPFSEGLASAEKNGLYGFINREGKIVIAPQFYSTLFFTDGYSMVDVGAERNMTGEHIPKFRFVNRKGEILEPDQYDNVDLMFMNGFAFVSKDVLPKLGEVATTKQGLINRKGKLVVPLSFRFLFRNFFKDGFEFATDYDEFQKGNKLVGLIDSTGKWVTKAIFENAMAFAEGVAPIRQNEKWGFINMKGEMIITPQFDSVCNFHEGLAAAKVNGKFGFIDHQGKWIIKAAYESATCFAFGLAPVKINDKYGYINSKGKWVVQPQFEKAGTFQNVNSEKTSEIR